MAEMQELRDRLNQCLRADVFTAQDGTKLPYRYYIPERAVNAPLLFYLHGNGSRGTDNQKQLTFIGASVAAKLFAERKDFYILAPQCPRESAWVPDGGYLGQPGFAQRDMSVYLRAAVELLREFLLLYPVDTKRLYATGSSNGAGACWELTVRYPHLFAGIIPVAGGKGGGESVRPFAQNLAYTPMWTFHGTADPVLPCAATQAIIEAARAAGNDQARFTPVPGATHDDVWQLAAQTAGLGDWLFAQRNAAFGVERAF